MTNIKTDKQIILEKELKKIRKDLGHVPSLVEYRKLKSSNKTILKYYKSWGDVLFNVLKVKRGIHAIENKKEEFIKIGIEIYKKTGKVPWTELDRKISHRKWINILFNSIEEYRKLIKDTVDK